ncbi:MAG: hypothetical protein ACEQSR_00735 [Candidatus Methylacidiphilales bacterium]
MLKYFILWFCCINWFFANAQQVITFLDKQETIADQYRLPQKVTLKSNTGKFLEAILTNVNGDTLYFKSLKDRNEEFSMRYSQIKSIKFHHNAEAPLYIGKYAFFALGTGLTFMGTVLILHGSSNVESAQKYITYGTSILFAGAGSFLISLAFNSGLPKEFKFKNNALKVNN